MARTTAIRKPARRFQHGPSALILIGVYKVFEGVLLTAAGFGLLKLLHKDVGSVLMHWVHVLGVDPDNRYIHRLLERGFSINPHQLRELSVGTFIYAGLRFTEGFGLIYRKRWAEYLTVIATALFIPLEIYEMARHLTWPRLVTFVVNVAIVWYLVAGLRKTTTR